MNSKWRSAATGLGILILSQAAGVTVDKGKSENGTLVPAWSHAFGAIWYHVYPIAPSPALGDLQGSAALEVVSGNEEYYAKAGVPGEWYCFNASGGELWRRNTTNDEARTSPILADVDGDGTLEIAGATTSGNQLQLLDRLGAFRWRFAVDGYSNNPASPALCDLVQQTGEGATPQLEMLGASLNGTLYCLDADPSDGVDDGFKDLYANATGDPRDVLWKFQAKGMGWQWVYSVATGWTYVYGETASRIFSAPAAADLDGDGQKEVVFGSDAGTIYCLRGSDGAKLWEYKTAASVRSSAALADVDGDGKREILVGSQDKRVLCLRPDGTLKWSFLTGGPVDSSPTVADLDGDGKPEVVVGSGDKKAYCLSALDGALKWSVLTNGAVLSSATPANRTGNHLDLYLCSNDGFLYLLDGPSGTVLDRFYAGAKIQSSPSVADLDGDGHLEVLFMDWAADNNNLSTSYQSAYGGAGDTLWCLKDMGSKVAPFQSEWPMFRGDPCHTGTYTKAVKSTQAVPTLQAQAVPALGNAPLTVGLSMSVQTPGSLSKLEWDFDGNGTYDWSSALSGSTTTTYTGVGTFKATARVTDNLGQVVTDSVEVVVQKALAPPVAAVTATPASGKTPLNVQLAGTGQDGDGVILLYQWDFEGDGSYDWSSTTTGVVAHTYGEAGAFTARLKVTDDDNLSAIAETQIVVEAALKPPVIMCTASPDQGPRPLDTVLTAAGTDEDGQIVLWEWDFEGDGTFDYSSSANPYSGTTTHVYETVGTFNATVRATDNTGLTATASTQVAVSNSGQLKVWISKPKDGWDVSGKEVPIRIQTAPGASATDHVVLQWRKQGETEWKDHVSLTPKPLSFFDATFDVTAFPDGQVLDLRAVATHKNGKTTATSPLVTVTVDNADPHVSAGPNLHGEHEVKQKISQSQEAHVAVNGGVSVSVPYGALDKDTHVTVTKKASNAHPTSGAVEAGSFVDIELDNVGAFSKPLTITLPYQDENGDGVEDTSGLPAASLKMYAYTTAKGIWEELPSNSVNLSEHTVTAQTPHLSSFGLFGGSSGASFGGGGLGGGGGGSCFLDAARRR